MNKNLIDKVKEIFRTEKFADEPINAMVKTKDGDIFMVKDTEVKVGAEIVKMDQDEEVAILDGDYILDDESTLTIAEGKITVITPKKEEDTVVEEEIPAVVEASTEVKMAVIKQINKWSMDIDQDSLEVGTILTQTWVNGDGSAMEPTTVSSGEYEMENGDLIQVDSNGKIVLITPKTAETLEESVEMKALRVELEAFKAEKENFEKEAIEAKLAVETAKAAEKEAKEAFEKLQKAPAVKAVDTRKFEKTSTKTEDKEFKFSKNNTLSAVQQILKK